MASQNLRALVGKLNAHCRRQLEAAAGLCLSRTNYNVEIEHWLLKLMEGTNTDLSRLFRHYDVHAGQLTREITKSLDSLKTGNARAPELSPDIVDLIRAAWELASLDYNSWRVRSGHLFVALLTDRGLARIRGRYPELAKLNGDQVQRELATIIAGSAEDAPEPGEAPGPGTGETPVPHGAAGSKTPALDQFTQDLTDRARKKQIDPVIGRDFEIRQVIDILTRRRQNNPILTGEAGVGKTAVVEGFALRVASGDVPAVLKNVAVRTLDLGLLQAGAGVKGEFENRLKSVIAEVKASPQPIILFIDEAHTLIGAGGAAGQGDAANLLKPALARGELRTIAATTWAEYKKFFETDAALKRRFQVVKVEEPDEEKAIRMIRGFAFTLENHHRLRIEAKAIEDAVKLSLRYITDRQLPDKAISLLDTACARVALGQSATPPPLEDCRREIELIDVELGILQREQAVGGDHAERIQELTEHKAHAEKRLAELEDRWKKEKELVVKIQEIRNKLEAHAAATDAKDRLADADEKKLRTDLAQLQDELTKLQGETPLVKPVVDKDVVAEVVSGWTGIPIGKMVRNEIEAVLALKEKLEERVVGQSHALEAIAKRIQTARAGLMDPRRPIGVFMLLGSSGVGKTETAMALAEILYGGDRNMVVINMSEYKEDHKISRLTGSAPGYVGYGEGGVLTEAVRRKPYSIVLLDEVEKANVAVQEIFYQVFDKGTLQDDKGNEVNFKNTIILLTSNVGSDTIIKLTADPDTRPEPDALLQALRPDLLKAFKPALLGRLNIVPYYPLGDEVLKRIIRLQLGRIGERIRLNHRAAWSYDDALVDAIAGRCKEVETGARTIDHIITGTLLPEISREFLTRMAEGHALQRVHVGVGGDGGFVYRLE